MKKLLFSFLLSIFFLSCGNNFVSPSSYTKEEIDKKYPYWNVGVAGFFIKEQDEYTEITIIEKRFFLEGLALMRLTINTDEFVQAYKENKDKFLADQTIAVGENGAIYGSIKDSPFDIDRLIEVIRATKYDIFYGKGSHKDPSVVGLLGDYSYAFYGSSKKPRIGNTIMVHNNYIIGWYGLAFFSALMYHEHLHNLGFTHNSNRSFYEMQSTMRDVANRIVDGDLKEKYKKSLDELTAYYITEYKNLLMSSTVYTPKK